MANLTNDNNVALNNFLQNKGKAASLSWDDQFTGPRHDGMWTSKCKVDGEIMGTGTGAQKTAARDEAAKQALSALKAQEAAEAETATD